MLSNKKQMELKVMYCKDIKAFNFFQKLALYVVVSLAIEDPDKIKMIKHEQSQRTLADKEGGENPEWNKEETTTMHFDLEEAASCGLDHVFLTFEVRHQGSYFGDKTIAEVRVPLEDLIDETSPDGILRFVSYQARGVEGGPNGVVHFSYKLLNFHGNQKQKEHRHELSVPVGGDQKAASVRSGGLYPVVETSIVPRSVELYADPKEEDIRPPPTPTPPPPPHGYYPPPFGTFMHHRPPPPPPPLPIYNPHSPVFHHHPPPHPSGASYAYGGNWGAPPYQ